ncbi:hypothetical protein ACQXXY_11795 [Corynebacterium diphtheriae]
MTITDTQNSVNAIRLAFKKVREGLIDAAHAAGMLESDLVNALSSIPVETQAPEPEPVEQETPAPAPAESVRLFVCGGLGLQVVRESVGVSHG